MSKQPLVSIVIPCFNAAPRLKACLASCLQQTYPNIEIIVVDNNSTDASQAIVQSIAATSSRPLRLLHCSQPGQNQARNHGLTQAQGDYIQWLDADDVLEPDKIARQVTALEQSPDHDIAYGSWDWCIHLQNQPQFRLAFKSQPLDDPLRAFLLHFWYPLHSYLLRRRAAEQLHEIQAWHPETRMTTDTEYFALAALLKFKFLDVTTARVQYHYWGKTQMSRSMPYEQRVQNWRHIQLRLEREGIARCVESLSADHWFLLRLNWDFWRLAPVSLSQHSDRCFWLEHEVTQVGMTLNAAEARIVLVISRLRRIDTLMGHTNQIIRFFWKFVLQESMNNEVVVADELSRLVGLLPDAHLEVDLLQALRQYPANSLSFVDVIPMQVPLFLEQRFAILRLLDRLRVLGLLTQVASKSHAIQSEGELLIEWL
jgi:hypothetical protein